MHKYEIMMMLNPKADEKEAFGLVEGIFKKSNVKKAEKLENTDLAYEIKKSTKTHYFLFEVEAESNLIAEFTRKTNISKDIWRVLVINLDTERGYGKVRKQHPSKKPFIRKNTNNRNSTYNRNNNESYTNNSNENTTKRVSRVKKDENKVTRTRTKKTEE